MIYDDRQKLLANNLVTYSCGVKKGDKVWIDAAGCDGNFTSLLVREIYAAGGMPFVNLRDNRIQREILAGATDEMLDIWAERDAAFMEKMDCYIGVRGGGNSYELSDVPEERMQEYDKRYQQLRCPSMPVIPEDESKVSISAQVYGMNVCILEAWAAQKAIKRSRIAKALDTNRSYIARGSLANTILLVDSVYSGSSATQPGKEKVQYYLLPREECSIMLRHQNRCNMLNLSGAVKTMSYNELRGLMNWGANYIRDVNCIKIL